MPQSGIWLSAKDALQISKDLLSIGYALRIEGRRVTSRMTEQIGSYCDFFGGTDCGETAAGDDSLWPTMLTNEEHDESWKNPAD